MKLKQFLSGILALLFVVSLPVSALAAEWDIGKGDITVNAGSGGQTVTQGGGAAVADNAPVITGSSTENTVTINAEKDQTANVTLSGANIDVSGKSEAAVTTTGDGNVSIELNGDSTLKSGEEHAGLEKNNGGSLTIGDENKDGKLTATGGTGGAGIGNGGSSANGSRIPGAEVDPDTSGLTTNGSIAYYAPGEDMEKDEPTSTTVGTLPPQEKPVETGAERSAAAPLYRVTDKDGRNVAYTTEQKGGVLTVMVDADFAILTGSLRGIRTLKAQGVEKIVFVTKEATSAFALADLLESGSTGKTYQLTHDGKTVTFTLGEDMADVSAILTQP